MCRHLLALSLMLFAGSAMADNVVAAGDPADNANKQGKSTAVGASQDGESANPAQPATTPARSATPRSTSPRWHSMLPGMIR